MGKLIDLTGKRFGKLMVNKMLENKNNAGSRLYECECDCGNIVFVYGCNLTRTNESTKSCGCLQRETIGNMRRKEFGKSAFNQLFLSYKKTGAEYRGLDFELSEEEFRYITKQNCLYCGSEPSQIKKSQSGNGNYVYNGIDRIDSSLGYTSSNCVPCCGRCNSAKSSEKQEDFKSWIEKVYNHFVKPQ